MEMINELYKTDGVFCPEKVIEIFNGIDIQIDEYCVALENKCYKDADYNLHNISEALALIIPLIVDCLFSLEINSLEDIELDQLQPEIFQTIKNNRHVLSILANQQKEDDDADEAITYDKSADDEYRASALALFLDIIQIKKEIDTIKIEYVVLAILITNDQNDYKVYSIAKALIRPLQLIFHGGKIEKLKVQASRSDKESSNRGSNNYTTQILIIISLNNLDKYIYRLDLPHKGQNNFHINLEEVKIQNGRSFIDGSAFPYSNFDSEFLSIKELLGENTWKLFYRQEVVCWFKSNFEKLVDEYVKDEEIKKTILKKYYERKHYKIYECSEIVDDKDIYVFTEQFRSVVSRLRIINFEVSSIYKNDTEIIHTIEKLKWMDYCCCRLAECLMTQQGYYKGGPFLNIKEILWKLLHEGKITILDKQIRKEEFLNLDFPSLYKIIQEAI